MTLKNASKFLAALVQETSKKSELKVYSEFTQIIASLEKRDFSKEEMQLIEAELEHLTLAPAPTKRKRYIKKALEKFKKHLKEQFSLVPKGHYTELYGGLGLSFGLVFGVAIFSNLDSMGIGLGLIGGMLVGAIMGRNKDAQAKADGNVL